LTPRRGLRTWNLGVMRLGLQGGELLKHPGHCGDCIAVYKYFFVSLTGKFWLCSQVRTERHILDITREDLLGYNRKKSC
jgi:hypothetical protein